MSHCERFNGEHECGICPPCFAKRLADMTRQRDEAIRERDELRARVRGIYWRDVMIGGRMKQADWILSPDQHSAPMNPDRLVTLAGEVFDSSVRSVQTL